MAKQKHPKKSIIKKKKRRKPRASWNDAMLQLVENHVFDTGRVEDANEAIGVARSTFYSWLKKREDLMEAVTRAREAHKKFKERSFRGEMMAALDGLNILLAGHVVTLREEITEEIRNEETGEKLETLKVRVREHQSYIRPDIRAIEKVLGSNDLKHNAYLKSLQEHVLNNKSELYRLIFGHLVDDMDDAAIGEFLGVSVLNVQLDLLKIRYMEAHVQHLYDVGDLTVDQWMEYTQKLRRDYGYISDRMETRAQKLLDGASYQEVIYQMEELWRVLIETTREELAKPIEHEGKTFIIPAEVVNQIAENIVNRVNERKSNQTYFLKRIT